MFKDLIRRIAAELKGRGIPYMIIGGQAVLHHGEPRLTKDIDITLGAGIERLPEIKDIITVLGFSVDAAADDAFVKDTMVLPAADKKTGIRVDFVFSFSAFEREAIERSDVVDYDGVPVRFASLEDLVIHKMVAGRPRDIEDVRSILLKNPGYDRDFIRGWLSDFDRAIAGGSVAEFDELVHEIARESARRPAKPGGTAKELKPARRRRSGS